MKLEWHINGKHQFKLISDEMPVIIGRSEDCDVTLDDFCVSRHHAVLGYEDGSMKLKALNSKNPIMVNGHYPISSNEPYTVKSGDSFIIGRIEMMVSAPGIKKARSTVELKMFCPACGGRAAGTGLTCAWCGAQLYEQEAEYS